MSGSPGKARQSTPLDAPTYRLCWPRLFWLRAGGYRVLTGAERGKLIGIQINWRRSREIDDAF